MNAKSTSALNALAAEALDLWQEHLAALAADPQAKADLAQLLEPSRRLFADWMEKAQDAAHAAASHATTTTPAAADPREAKAGAASAGLASDDGSLRFAQLALHVAELEKRVARLESRKVRAARKTAGTAERA